MEEIKYLEQATLESCSTSSKGSNRSKISKQSGRSTTNSESQTKIDKYELSCQQICDLTDPNSWFYIDTSSNPVDDTSQGLTAKQLSEDSQCLTSPELLWKKGPCKPEIEEVSPLQESDLEVRKGFILIMEVKSVVLFPDHFETRRLVGVSRWYQARKVIALCLQLKSKFQGREVKKPGKPVTRSKAVVKKIVP